MNDSEARLDDVQRRLIAALDRIGQGVDGLQPAAPAIDPEEVAALKQALEDEKLVTAQLQERIATLKARADEATSAADAALNEQRAAMAQLDGDLQRLRAANEKLRENNQALRDANAAGVGEAELINQGMVVELEALRASHAADRSEAQAIVSVLTPMLSETARAEGEG